MFLLFFSGFHSAGRGSRWLLSLGRRVTRERPFSSAASASGARRRAARVPGAVGTPVPVARCGFVRPVSPRASAEGTEGPGVRREHVRVGRRCGLQSRLPASAGVVVSVGVPASPHSLPRMSPRPLGAQDAVFTVLLGYVCHVKLGPGVREKEDGHLPSSRDKLSGSGLPSVLHPWGPVQVAVAVPAPCVWRPRGPRLPAEVRPSTSTLRAAPRSPSHSPGGRSRRRLCQVGRLRGHPRQTPLCPLGTGWHPPLLSVGAGASVNVSVRLAPAPGPGRGPDRDQGLVSVSPL